MRLVLSPHPARAVVDEGAAAPGRGAWLHADRACLDQAEHRRAVPRALRVAGPVDLDAVRAWFDQHAGTPACGPIESSKKKAGWKPMGTR